MIKEDCSNCSGDLGNTRTKSPKTINPAKRWFFTLNNYTEKELCSIVPIQDLCKHMIVGKEVGEGGTPHLQGFINLLVKKRPMSLGLSPRIHWEKAKGNNEENLIYCSKEGNVVISKGFPEPLKILKDNQMKPWQREILKIIETEADDRTIHWYWSSSGGLGKTTFCKYLTAKHDALPLCGKGDNVRHGVAGYLESKGYTPKLVVFPIPRSYNASYISYTALENVKDMYFYSGKYEGCVINGNCPHMFVFANEPPDETGLSVDRWRIVEITE